MAPRTKKASPTKASTKTNNKEHSLSSPQPSKSKKSQNTPSLVTPASSNTSKRRTSSPTSKGQSPGESSDGASPIPQKQMFPPSNSPSKNRMVTPMMINVPNNMSHPPPRLPPMPHQGSPNNRSPSPGGNSNTPRTTTSRRGGRSRSPSSHIRRANAPSPSLQGQKQNDDFGNRPPSSAAAAAAAAAKALGNHHHLQSNPSQQWYGNGEEDEFFQHQGSPNPRGNYGRGAGRNAWPDQEQGPGYEDNIKTPSRFAEEDNNDQRSALRRPIAGPYMRGGSPPQGGNYPPGQDFRQRPPPHQYPRSGNPNQYGRYNQSPQDMRYSNNRRPRNEEEFFRQQQQRRNMTPTSEPREADYYNNRDDGAGSPASIMTAKRSGAGGSKREGGGTKSVIGTPTPIHVPRAASSSSLSSAQRGNNKTPQAGTPASVFRGRPGDNRNKSNQPSSDESDENSPQKILLSLRTPTKSFDDDIAIQRKNELSKNKKRSNAAAGSGGPNSQPPPESPQEPPRIQHSHHQSHMSPNSLFFEPRQNSKQQQQNQQQQQSPSEQLPPNANPAPASGIEMAPSFNLFNNSFDSLGDAAHYLTNVGPGPFDSSLVNSQSFGVNPSQSFAGMNGGEGEGRKPQQQEPGEPILRQGSTGPYLSTSASKGGVASFGLNMTPSNSFGHHPPTLALSRSGDGVRSILLGTATADEQDAEGGGHMVVRQSPSSSGGNSPLDVQSDAAAAAGAAAQDIYRSFSNGGGNTNQQKGSPFRMRNVDSGIGGGLIGRMNSTGSAYGSSPGHYHPRERAGPPPSYHNIHPEENVSNGSLSFVRQPSFSQHSPQRNRIPSFYFVLCRYKNAFKNCTFLLPGLKTAMKKSNDDFLHSMGSNGLGDSSSGGYTPDRRDIDMSSMRRDRDRLEFTPAPSNTPTRSRRRFPDPSPTETEIAMRRVASSICAFGGSSSASLDMTNKPSKVALTGPDSIFRTKDSENGESLAVSVTLSSSSLTKHARRVKSQARIKYEEALPNRYYENENRLSWEFEENPPVQSAPEGEGVVMSSSDRKNNDDQSTASGSHKRVASSAPEDTVKGGNNDRPSKKSKTAKKDGGEDGKTTEDDDSNEGENESAEAEDDPSSPSSDKKSESGGEEKKDTPKIKYRCKLCGQPKQNHTCPYRQSLQRNIGVMIYPAVNAFTSSEPGLLAPALSEMNNFVSLNSEMSLSTDTSPSRSTPDRPTDASTGDGGMAMSRSGGPGSSPPNVTPETLRSAMHAGSPGSSLSGGAGGTPQSTPFRTKGRKNVSTPGRSSHLNYAGGARMSASQTPGSNSKSDPDSSRISIGDASSSGESSTDLLFVDAMELKPEQYRIVTPKSAGSMDPNAYSYPPLPLPYAQRKRLSDNLFAMSKEIPHLTDECAVVLREAREKDMWDIAVAQLMTQVVVVVHCPEGDNRLDGLRQYLLTLGIAC